MSNFEFSGKTTLITGASSGLGAEFATQLAARGSNLVLVARSTDRLESHASQLRGKYGAEVVTLTADLGRSGDVSRVVAFTGTTAIDVLVHNAGFGTYGMFAELDASRERDEIIVNVAAAVELAHAVLPGMLARRTGGIITVASTIGFQPSPRQAVYGATKAFALAFSEALWSETRGSGVRIVALCPGPTATGFLSGLGDERAASSAIYRSAANPVRVVRLGLRGFDEDRMTVIPGWRNWIRAQGHRFMPRAAMARLAGRMLGPQTRAGGDIPGGH